MSFAELVQDYGYYAVLLGTLLEGETILVMAGFAAHGGYLHDLAYITGKAYGFFGWDVPELNMGTSALAAGR